MPALNTMTSDLTFSSSGTGTRRFVISGCQTFDGLHGAFVDRIKEAYGKRLSRRMPRITSVNTLSGDRRFNVVDPGGNWLYIGQPLTALEIKRADQQSGNTRLAKAVKNARTFAYSKGDVQGAAKIIDVALTKN
jgi:hypothetical protein